MLFIATLLPENFHYLYLCFKVFTFWTSSCWNLWNVFMHFTLPLFGRSWYVSRLIFFGGRGVGLRVVWFPWCEWMASVTKVLSGVFTVKITAWFSTNKNYEYRCLVSADRWTWFYVWLFSCCHLFLLWEVGYEIQCWLPWQLAGYSIGRGRVLT